MWADEGTDDEVLGMVVRTGELHKLAVCKRFADAQLSLANCLNDSSSALLLFASDGVSCLSIHVLIQLCLC